jgi:hypothetical protein
LQGRPEQGIWAGKEAGKPKQLHLKLHVAIGSVLGMAVPMAVILSRSSSGFSDGYSSECPAIPMAILTDNPMNLKPPGDFNQLGVYEHVNYNI